MNRIISFVISSFILISCGGGGGGGSSAPTPAPTPAASVTISAESSKGYTTQNSAISWTSSNASSCTASNAWSGTKGTSGTETYSFTSAGSYTFSISCSGSGGSGSDSVTINVFDYKKVVEAVPENYEWDAYTQATVVNWYTPGTINGVYSETWLENLAFAGIGNNYPLTTTVIEPNESSLNIRYEGSDTREQPVNLNLQFNAWNQDIIPLYEVGNTEPSYALIYASFQDLDVAVFTPYPDKQIAENILYVTGGQLIGETKDGLRTYLLPTLYGDYTQASDMPSGTRAIQGDAIYYLHEASYLSSNTYNVNLAVSGTSNINFDFDNGTLTGELVLKDFMDLDEFLIGNGPNALYTSIPTYTINLLNGGIIGEIFYAELSLEDSVNDVFLTGYLEGRFFGPDGREIAASISFYDNDSEFTDDLFLGGGLLIGNYE